LGMGLLKPDQVRQIANVVTGTNNKPMAVLRSLNEWLDILSEENPQTSNTELTVAAESAVQALIAGAKNAKERQRKPGPWQTLAAFEIPREALREEVPGRVQHRVRARGENGV